MGYDYEPTVGLKSSTQPNALATYYDYDGFQRLKQTKDPNGDLTHRYQYQYGVKNTLTHSQLRTATTNESDAEDPSKAVITIQYLDGLGPGQPH